MTTTSTYGTDAGTPAFEWTDFEPESQTTGDGSGDPDKHILTILDPEGEEYATIVHRVCGGKYPIDGPLAEEKRQRAQHLVETLNADHFATVRPTGGGGDITAPANRVISIHYNPEGMPCAPVTMWVSPAMAARPEDALDGWDPATRGTDVSEYDYVNVFGESNFQSIDEALTALTHVHQRGELREPA